MGRARKKRTMATTMRNMLERGKFVDTLSEPEPDRFVWSLPSAKQETDYGEWADYVGRRIPPDTQIFLDTCFITSHEIPRQVWDALLSRRIVLTPMVRDELRPWFEKPRCNSYFRDAMGKAHEADSPNLRLASYGDYGGREIYLRFVIPFYAELLAMRKQEAWWIVDRFKKTNDREPTEAEVERLFQRTGDERGYWIRKKGYQTRNSDHLAADEELVSLAVLDSLTKGTDCMLMTRDADVLDQFYKLTILVDRHYRDMWFADYFHRNKGSMKTQRMPDTEHTRKLFNPENSMLVEKPDGIPKKLYPRLGRQILLCVLFGGERRSLVFTPMLYVADKDMWRLCVPRAVTRGRCCTHLLDGLNCYCELTPIGIDNKRFAIITDDKIFDLKWAFLTYGDVDSAIHQIERAIFRNSSRTHFMLDSQLLQLQESMRENLGDLREKGQLRVSISHTLLPYEGFGTRSRKPD